MDDKNKVILLWDLHEVVFKKDWKTLFYMLLSKDTNRFILKKLPIQLFSLCKGALKAKREEKRKTISVADILYIAQQEKNRALIDFVFKVSCAYTPILPTITIIKELKNKGFTHHIGSNIARPVFEQFKSLYPDIFALFDYAHVVDVTSRKSVIQKPDPTFFTTYLAKYHLKAHEVLFIDDKKRNIKTASSVGLNTIHFKKASQLEKELKLKNLL